MNRTVKIAALGAALAVLLTAFASCESEDPKIAESYEKIVAGSNNALDKESGEIYITEKTSVENDVDGNIVNGTTETYITYTGTESPVFTLSTTVSDPETGEPVSYELIKDGDTVLELIGGNGDFIEAGEYEAPDIFETFRIDFESSDIAAVTVTPKENGVQLYTLTMKSAYADNFDTEAGDNALDCTAATYEYYVSHEKVLEEVTFSYTYTLTADGKSGQLVKRIDSKIA